MNLFKNIFLVTFLLINFCKCKQGNSEYNAAQAQIRSLNLKDKFVRDIPNENWPINFLRSAENDIGLDSLRNGFDSIQIRIWNGCCGYKYKPADYWLMSLILDKKGWKAELSDLSIEDTSPNQRDSMSRKIKYRHPRSDWDDFIAKLFNLKILLLPDFEKIKRYQDRQDSSTDGCGIIIEIATKKIYRVYGYDTPQFYVDNYPEAKDILEIIKLIENEFEIKYEESNKNFRK